MTTKIKRSLFRTFLNTGTIDTPVWSLIGAGVTEAQINYNPKTTEETYIHEDGANVSVDSYAPVFPVRAVVINEEAVFEFIDDLRKNFALLDDAEINIVNVWLYETPAGGYYHAEKQNVSIQIDSFGGPGGQATIIEYIINFIGDVTIGIFDPTNLVFEALPITTVLTTMAADGVTLIPLFTADKTNLLYTASVINEKDSTNLTSTLASAESIVQKEGLNVIAQGDPASLAVGVNNITIEVTVGIGEDEEINTYRIDITRAASS